MTGKVYSALANRDREFGPFLQAPSTGEGEWRHWHLGRDD